MKKLITASAIAVLVAGAAIAGGMSAPVMEPEIVQEEARTGSRAGILVPILAILLIGLAMSNDSSTPVPLE